MSISVFKKLNLFLLGFTFLVPAIQARAIEQSKDGFSINGENNVEKFEAKKLQYVHYIRSQYAYIYSALNELNDSDLKAFLFAVENEKALDSKTESRIRNLLSLLQKSNANPDIQFAVYDALIEQKMYKGPLGALITFLMSGSYAVMSTLLHDSTTNLGTVARELSYVGYNLKTHLLEWVNLEIKRGNGNLPTGKLSTQFIYGLPRWNPFNYEGMPGSVIQSIDLGTAREKLTWNEFKKILESDIKNLEFSSKAYRWSHRAALVTFAGSILAVGYATFGRNSSVDEIAKARDSLIQKKQALLNLRVQSLFIRSMK